MNAITEPVVVRFSKPVDKISTPEEIAAKAVALQDCRANKRNGGAVTCYGARYSKRADQVEFLPAGIDGALLDHALSLRLQIPAFGRTNAQRAVIGLVERPRSEWYSIPSNDLIRKVIGICEKELANKAPTLDAFLGAVFSCTP